MQMTDSLCDKGMLGGLWQDPGTEDSDVDHSPLHNCQPDRHADDDAPYVYASGALQWFHPHSCHTYETTD